MIDFARHSNPKDMISYSTKIIILYPVNNILFSAIINSENEN